VDTTLFALHQV
jgi:hypothetical protein